MKSFLAALLLLVTPVLAQTPSQKRPFTFEDMMKLKRVGAPVPSPDGKWVVFDCEDVDLTANKKTSHLWIVPASGGESRRLNPTTTHEERPRFSADGKRLIWTSKATDPTQIWMCDFDPSAGQLVGKPHQVTSISTGADGGIWSPDGKNIVFVSAVYPDCKDDACNKQRDEELKKSKVKAKVFTRLFYRHWNAFTEFKRSHLFVIPADATVEAGVSPALSPESQLASASGGPLQKSSNEPHDLTPGDHDVPPFSLGGQDMYTISPDGQEVAYTSNIDEVEATSTNNEIFIVPISGGTSKKISTSPGSDTTPLYSPDGKYLAWRSQARAAFEADKWRLFLLDRQSGTTRDLTETFDRSAGSFTWWGPGAIYFACEDHGHAPIYVATAEPRPDGSNAVVPLQPNGPEIHADDLTWIPDTLFFSKMSIGAPNEIWKTTANGTSHNQTFEPVTHMNEALLSQIDIWFAAPIAADRIGKILPITGRTMEIDHHHHVIPGRREQLRVPAIRPLVSPRPLRPAVDQKF